jgi:hypothetical protein
MLRKIQQAAATVTTILSVGALFDLLMAHLGKLDLPADASSAFPLTGMPFTPALTAFFALVLGAILLGAAIVAQWSVMTTCHASKENDVMRVNHLRRFTWMASIIQTTGCLLFIFNGILLFVPAAMALLLVGVAELASILQEDVAEQALTPFTLSRQGGKRPH